LVLATDRPSQSYPLSIDFQGKNFRRERDGEGLIRKGGENDGELLKLEERRVRRLLGEDKSEAAKNSR